MKTAVCDDNKIFLEEMKMILYEHQEIEEVHTYSEIDEFFEKIGCGEKYDVVFLDIDWGNVDTTGFEFGEKLYKVMPHVPVILVTGYNDRFAQHVLLSEMNLVGYLTKPVDRKVVAKYLEKAKGKSKRIHYLNLFSQGTVTRLQTEGIVHIESHNHKTHIYTEDKMYIVYEKISDILKRLPEEFVQCHKSFLVNLNWITAIEGKEVVIKNGRRIPISRSYQNNIKDSFFTFIGEQI